MDMSVFNIGGIKQSRDLVTRCSVNKNVILLPDTVLLLLILLLLKKIGNARPGEGD